MTKTNVKIEVFINDEKSQEESPVLTVEFTDRNLYPEDVIKVKNRIGQALNQIYPIAVPINYRIHRPNMEPATGYYKRQEFIPYNQQSGTTIGEAISAKDESSKGKKK